MNLYITVFAIGLLVSVEVLSKHPPPQHVPQDETTAQFTAQIERQAFVLQLPFVIQQEQLHDGAELAPYQAVIPTVGQTVTPFAAIVSPTPFATPTPTASAPVDYATTTEGALATYRQPSALPISGYAMFYNPNVMQEVVHNRLAMGHVSACGECIGNVALLRAGDLNRRVWLQWADGVVEGPFLVADAAAPQHVDRLLARNWVVDVDYQTAIRRKMAGPVLVTVWGAPPPNAGAPAAVDDVALQQARAAPFEPLYATPTVALPTALPTEIPTALPSVVATPMPLATAPPSPPRATVPQGFPPDTPVPPPTPLPALYTNGNAPMPSSTPTVTVLPPTTMPSAIPTSVATAVVSPTVQQKVIQHAFPPDTPVPSPTALPALYPVATPTPTVLTK